MKQKLSGFLTEWIAFTLMFFFLYDIFWALADIEDLKHTLSTNHFYLVVDFVFCGIFSMTSLLVSRRILNSKYFKQRETQSKHVIRNGALVVVSNMLLAGTCEIFFNIADPDFTEDLWGTSFLFGILASLMALILLSMHYSARVIQKNKENAALQKKYLKLQLDPHFVYNSLGALAGMIELEPKTAEEYLVKFSRVYGYLLRHIEIDYIDIGEAADFVAVYVDMLNKRYHGNIVLQNEINAETDQGFILALSLQLLIENAVKHNYPQEDQKLYIRIYVRDKMLVVRNNRIYNGCRNDQNVESYGIGIRNLCRRYELECGTQPEFQATTDAFEARLPVLPKKQDI